MWKNRTILKQFLNVIDLLAEECNTMFATEVDDLLAHDMEGLDQVPFSWQTSTGQYLIIAWGKSRKKIENRNNHYSHHCRNQ